MSCHYISDCNRSMNRWISVYFSRTPKASVGGSEDGEEGNQDGDEDEDSVMTIDGVEGGYAWYKNIYHLLNYNHVFIIYGHITINWCILIFDSDGEHTFATKLTKNAKSDFSYQTIQDLWPWWKSTFIKCWINILIREIPEGE